MSKENIISFDAEHKNTPKEKITEYKLDGKPITISKKRGKPIVVRNPLFYTQEKKIEAASLYCVLGDAKQVALLAKVPEAEVRKWRQEPWWADIQKTIMLEQNDGLLSKINNTIDQALAMLEDRVVNGDCEIIDAKPAVIGKDGNIVADAQPAGTKRTPVKARDLSQIFNALSHQRNLMRGDPTQIVSQTSTETRLLQLQEQFKSMAKGTVLDGECKQIEKSE